MSQNRNRLAAGIAALVVVIGVVLGVILSKPAPRLDPASPQGAVQGYLSAALDRDFAVAVTYLDPAGGCKVASFDNAWVPANAEVTLVKATVGEATATVDVKVTYRSNDILGGGGSESHTYRLTKDGSRWLIANIPWPLYDCGTGK